MDNNIVITDPEYQPRKKLWAIDIETVSQGKRAHEYTDKAKYKLGNVKDEAKVKAALEKKKEEAAEKHALHWGTGKIISLALVDVYGDEHHVIHGHDEEKILSSALDIIKKPCKLIGKSSKTFDFPFIVGRLMANRLPVPSVFKQRLDQLDVDDFFGVSSASGQRGKLDLYVHGIGYKDKPMNGSDIGRVYAEIVASEMMGDAATATELWKKIADYNLYDSRAVALMARLYYGADRMGV